MRLPRALLLVAAVATPLALAGCLGGSQEEPAANGEGLTPAERSGGTTGPIATKGYDGVLEASAAVADTSAGTTVDLDVPFEGDFRGFVAVMTWKPAAAAAKGAVPALPGVPVPKEAAAEESNLLLSLRTKGEVVALAQAIGPSPLTLKVEPGVLDGLEGPFELYVSAAGSNGVPVGATANQPFHVDATAFFGDRGEAQFNAFG